MAGRSAAGVVRVKEEVVDAAAQGPEWRREEAAGAAAAAAERLKEEEEELVGDEPVGLAAPLSGKKREREAEDCGSGGDGLRRLAERRRSATPAWLSVAPPRQPLQRLVDACRAAFDGCCAPPTADVVRSIRGIMDQIGPHDVGLIDELRYFHETNAAGRQNPPLITCKNILQCKNFTIAVFFLPMGAVMPLHDHPGMTVFTKLLMGSARLEAYDWVRPRIPRIGSSAMVAEKVLDHGVTAASGAWVLFPDAGGNMHRFTAGEHSHCAFLDVLAPPYTATGRRRCAYYRDSPCDLCACATRTSSRLREAQRGGRLAWLEEIAQPPSLRIGGLPYRGPTIF